MVLHDYNCVGCGVGKEETVEHLFLKCPFTAQCWSLLNLNSTPNLEPFQILESFRATLGVPFFMEIIILMCWSIWGSRNALIFEAEAQSFQRVKESFKSHFSMVIHRAKTKHVEAMKAWLETFV
jgi:hypothetical protein